MIDQERLLNYIIPEIRQTVTPRDVVFYALSVGLGQDPMDMRQLDYVDAQRTLKVLPSMALVLAHPGFWYADPETTIDALRIVHGEQALTLHHPLPVSGDLVSRTRVTGLVDKGESRGALLYSEKQLFDATTDMLLATSHVTTFLRGDGGFGGPAGPVRPVNPMPNTEPDIIVDLPTRPEQALYYRLNGDDNPLHADPAVAKRAGYACPILHGLCTLGVITHALLRELGMYDVEGFRELSLRFSAPVYPGETIRTEIWKNGAFRARVVERDSVIVNNGKAVFA